VYFRCHSKIGGIVVVLLIRMLLSLPGLAVPCCIDAFSLRSIDREEAVMETMLVEGAQKCSVVSAMYFFGLIECELCLSLSKGQILSFYIEILYRK